MKFFNFFRGITPDPIELLFEPTVILDEYNGVTNPFLIETFNEFKTYREWTEYFSLGIWDNQNREYLRFMFNDIDGRKYEITLLGDESMCIYISIETSFNHVEYELMHFPTEFLSNANILLNHIRSLPRALYSRRS